MCIFVGYPYGKKGWRLYDLETKEFLVSQDVVFVETSFPYCEEETEASVPIPITTAPADDGLESKGSGDDSLESKGSSETTVEAPVIPAVETEATVPVESVTQEEVTNVAGPVELGRGHRQKSTSVRLKDYVTYNATALTTPDKHTSSKLTGSGSSEMRPGILYPIEHCITDDMFSTYHRVFLAAVSAGVEPKSFKEAMEDEIWRNAMSSEITSLKGQRTWDLTHLPPGKTALTSMWVYNSNSMPMVR